MRVIWMGALIAATLYLGICALLFVFQRSLLYFPQPGVRQGEVLEVDGEKVLVLSRAIEGPEAVIYFGGNAEDVAYSYPTLFRAFPDQALYLMKYRGYGGSTGKPTEAGLFRDAVALYDMVQKRHSKIVVVGRSLGSGVAAYLASVRKVERLVLVTPFDSVEAVAAEKFRYSPVRWLLRDKYESSKYVQNLSAPTLIVAAARDEVIPMARTQGLLEKFRPGVASMHVVEGVGHNDISEASEYILLLRGAPIRGR
jgi:fermentation-respiration switch protein FrsA (DUF1100 family)